MVSRVPETGVVRLCCSSSCCPTVDFTDPDVVTIKDDFGGEVKLTRDQWHEMWAKFTIRPQ